MAEAQSLAHPPVAPYAASVPGSRACLGFRNASVQHHCGRSKAVRVRVVKGTGRGSREGEGKGVRRKEGRRPSG
eukprot:3658571-Rhodomonas_salina.1